MRRISHENAALCLLLVFAVTAAVFFDVGESFSYVVAIAAFLAFIGMKAVLGESLTFSRLTIPAFFMLAYIAVMAIPALFVFSSVRHSVRYSYLLAIEGVLLLYPLGVFAANLTVKNPNGIIRRYFESPLAKHPTDSVLARAFEWLLLGSVPIVGAFVLLSSTVQLFEALQGYPHGHDPMRFRFAENDLPSVLHYAFEIMRRVMLPIAVLLAFLMSRVYGGRWKTRFRVVLPVALIVSSLTLDRSPPIALLLTLALGYLLASNQSIAGLFRPKLFGLILLAMAFGGTISIFQYQGLFGVAKALKTTWYVLSYRLAQDAAAMAAFVFQTYNAESGFLHGQAIRLFSILPGRQYAESLGEGQLVAAPVSFVGDLWRNWGWYGVIIGTLLVGFVHQSIQLHQLRRKTIGTITFHAILLLASVLIIHGNALGIVTTSILALAAWGAAMAQKMVNRFDASRRRLAQTSVSINLPT